MAETVTYRVSSPHQVAADRAVGRRRVAAHRYTAALAGEIELRWQDRWDADGTFEAPNPAGRWPTRRDRRSAPKLYVLDMFPYPSGEGLHVGHPLGFIGTDVFGRYKRMTGPNVLYTMGYDAFGLPAEQFAVRPASTRRTRRPQRRQLPPPAAPAGAGPRPAARDRHDRPGLLPVDAVDLHRDLRLLVRPRAATDGGAAGPADRRAGRPSSIRHAPTPDDGRRGRRFEPPSRPT